MRAGGDDDGASCSHVKSFNASFDFLWRQLSISRSSAADKILEFELN